MKFSNSRIGLSSNFRILLLTSLLLPAACNQLSLLHLKMGQNSNGLEWFGNVFKKMEDRCLEMCAVLEKEVLKYVKGQPNSVDIDEDHFQQPHLDVEEDQSPEKEHWANQNASSAGALEEHLPKTKDRVTIQSSDKQNHPIIEPNHISANHEVCGALKVLSLPSKYACKSQKFVKFGGAWIHT